MTARQAAILRFADPRQDCRAGHNPDPPNWDATLGVPSLQVRQEMNARVAVVTPYFKEQASVLRQCADSVSNQTFPCTHFAVADGFPSEVFEQAQGDVRHIRLPRANGDNGNTPRAVGTLVALAEGFDFIGYLDADNWYHPNHIESLLDLHELTNAVACCSKRTFHRPDGSSMDITDYGEDLHKYADTSAFLLHRSCTNALDIWGRMPKVLSPLCDRIFFLKLQFERYAMAFSEQRTLAFRTQYESHYRAANETPPPGVKTGADVFEKACRYLLSEVGADESVRALGFYPKPSSFG
jgi:glycosyltransferase involved in cell wall biosynthesis